MKMDFVEIPIWRLLLLALPLGLTLFILYIIRVKFIRSYLVASLRSILQLLLLGWIFAYIFYYEHPMVTTGILLVFLMFAAWHLLSMFKDTPRIKGPVCISLASVSFIMLFFLLTIIIHIEPWYNIQYVLPLAGMVLGNTMNSIALSSERFVSEIKTNTATIESHLAIGASSYEAAAPYIRSALFASLLPVINRTATVGVVSIPGIMSGQIIAGIDPFQAAKYQIAIIICILTADTLGAIQSVFLIYRKYFGQKISLDFRQNTSYSPK